MKIYCTYLFIACFLLIFFQAIQPAQAGPARPAGSAPGSRAALPRPVKTGPSIQTSPGHPGKSAQEGPGDWSWESWDGGVCNMNTYLLEEQSKREAGHSF